MTSTMLAVGVEEGTKKIRKPYTITKSRESWTEQEHDKFLEALQLFDRDWKKIEAFIGSKTVIQIRSHAQKYFLKVQKNGTGEHVPPPRPKRKSAQPYPQKASKLLLPDAITSNVTGKTGSSSDGSSIDVWPQESHSSSQLNPDYHLEATPDFAQIYKFIGSIFDPGVTGHLKRSREMAPIDRETIILLMRNLSINLSSPEFDEEKLFLPVYEMNAIEKQTTVTPNSDEKVGLS